MKVPTKQPDKSKYTIPSKSFLDLNVALVFSTITLTYLNVSVSLKLGPIVSQIVVTISLSTLPVSSKRRRGERLKNLKYLGGIRLHTTRCEKPEKR